MPNRYDAYFLDMESFDDVINFAKQMKPLDPNGHFIFMSENPNNAHLTTKIRSSYFITKPYEKEEIIDLFDEATYGENQYEDVFDDKGTSRVQKENKTKRKELKAL